MTSISTYEKPFSRTMRRPGRLAQLIAALSLLLAACAPLQEKEQRRVVGDQTGLTYVLTAPKDDKDPTIREDMEELVREADAMLAGVEQRSGADVSALPPIEIRFLDKGQTITGDPEQPGPGAPDERFNDETDGDPAVAQSKAVLVSFSAYKPATRNEFDVAIPSELRSLVLRDVETTGRRDGSSGPDGAKTDERVEGVHGEQLVPQGWSLNDDNRLQLGGVNSRITTWPWRAIVNFNYGGSNSGCSGSMIGPRHVVTAAHCINSSGTNNFFAFTVSSERGGSQFLNQASMPGCPNLVCPNIGATYWYFTPSQWRQSGVSNREQYDIGIIVLPARLGDQTGWMGYWYAPISALNTVSKYSRGYPSCNAFAGGVQRIDDPADPNACPTCTTDLTICRPNHLYGDAARCSIGNATNVDGSGYNRNFRMSCDGSAAMSGSPLYLYGNGSVGSANSVYYTAHDIQWTCGGTASASSCATVTRADRLLRLTPEYASWIAFFRQQFP